MSTVTMQTCVATSLVLSLLPCFLAQDLLEYPSGSNFPDISAFPFPGSDPRYPNTNNPYDPKKQYPGNQIPTPTLYPQNTNPNPNPPSAQYPRNPYQLNPYGRQRQRDYNLRFLDALYMNRPYQKQNVGYDRYDQRNPVNNYDRYDQRIPVNSYDRQYDGREYDTRQTVATTPKRYDSNYRLSGQGQGEYCHPNKKRKCRGPTLACKCMKCTKNRPCFYFCC